MGVLYCYFAAESDERAATALGLPGGPGGSGPVDPGLLAAVRAGDMAAYRELRSPRVRWSEHGFPTLAVSGIDPFVHLATLEELLTGTGLDDVMDGPRSAAGIATAGGDGPMVVSVTDELREALAHRSADDFTPVAAAWARTEELDGDAEPLARFLRELAGLARDALDRGDRLYCWVSL